MTMSSLFFFFLCTVAFSAGKSIDPNFFTNYPGWHHIRDSSPVQIPYDTYNNVIKPGQYQDIFKFTLPDTDKLTWTDLYKNKIPELEKETLKRNDFIQVPHPLTSMNHMHPYGMKTVEGPMGIMSVAHTKYPELDKETLKKTDFVQVPHPLTSTKYMHPYGMKTVEGPMGIMSVAHTKYPELEKETLKRSDFIQVPHPLTSTKYMHPYGMKTVEGPMGIMSVAHTKYPELEKETLKRSDFIQVPHPLTSTKYMHPYEMKFVEGPMGIIPVAHTKYPKLEKETLKRSDFIQVPQSLTSMKYMHPNEMEFFEGPMGIIPAARNEYPEWMPTHHRYHKKDDFDRFTFGYGGLDSRMAYKNKLEYPLEKVGTYKYIDADGKLKIVKFTTGKPGFKTVITKTGIPMMSHQLIPVKTTVDMKAMKDQKMKYDLSDETSSYLKNRLDSMEDESYEMAPMKVKRGELPSMMYNTNKLIVPDTYTVSGMVPKPFTYPTMQEPSFRTQNQLPHYVQYPYGIPMIRSPNYEVSPRTLFKV